MKYLKSIVLAVSAYSFCLSASAAPPSEETVQGLYEGTWIDGKNPAKTEVRVIAMGKGGFKLLARKEADGKIVRAEIDGKIEGDAVNFAGRSGEQNWKANYTDGAIQGTIGDKGKLELKRVVRTSPSSGKKAPSGAMILIDGKNFDNMKAKSGDWGDVDQKDGSIQVPKGGMNSVPSFAGSFDAHVEFRCPFRPGARSQGRGNSGCYLPCGQEIQVLDSFGMTTYLGGGCGGLYGKKDPDTMEPIPGLQGKKENVFNLTSFPPLQWQTYDIEYRVKNDDQGKEAGSLTVYHNGIKVHDNVALNHKAGGFRFQDHGNPVRYRNIWVLNRDSK